MKSVGLVCLFVWLFGWLVGCLFVCLFVCLLDWLVVCWLVGCLGSDGCLFGWLVWLLVREVKVVCLFVLFGCLPTLEVKRSEEK